jgi:capsular exopolysaccharide synthesis family protein
MTSRRLLEVFRRRWRWVAFGLLLGGIVAATMSSTATPMYRATASVFFSAQFGNSASDLAQGSTYLQDEVSSFAQLATTPAVLQPVVDELSLRGGVAALATRVQASAPVGTVIVQVSVVDPSAPQSASIDDAVVRSLSRVVKAVAPKDSSGSPTVQAVTVAMAEVPESPFSPNVPLELAIGLLAGLLLGTAAALTREALDNRVRDRGVVAELTPLPVIGEIPPVPSARVLVTDPTSGSAEAFRSLRTNLQFLRLPTDSASDLHVLAVSSSVSGEGKSTVALNLAASLAETGQSVLLLDADLRRPTVATITGLEGAVGLTTVLLGQAALADVVQEWGSSGLHVLPAGGLPPNPAELLGSPRMQSLLREMRGRYRFVVIDSPPLLPVADAAVLSQYVDGVLVIADVTRARRRQLEAALRTLTQIDAPTLGVVLTRVPRKAEEYRYDNPASRSRRRWTRVAVPPVLTADDREAQTTKAVQAVTDRAAPNRGQVRLPPVTAAD